MSTEMRPNRLRELRRAADLTQEELAARAGIHPQHVSDLERGKYRNPTLATMTALANALGVSVDDVFLPTRSGEAPDESMATSAKPDGSATATAPSSPTSEGEQGESVDGQPVQRGAA